MCHWKNTIRKPRTLYESDERSKKPIERVYTDVVELMKCESIGKAKYFVTLCDEYSGFSMAIFIHRKSETSEAINGMLFQTENSFKKRVERISCIKRKSVMLIR